MMRIFGFNWEVYAHVVMPAFACWLIERDEEPIQQLYQQTRSAREERVLPAALQQLRSYARARMVVLQLPQTAHAGQEYRSLCSAEQFTAQSDRYSNLHCPQLLSQNLGALRAVWGALVEEYCISQFALSNDDSPALRNDPSTKPIQGDDTLRFENGDDEIDDISRYAGPAGVELGRHPSFLSLRGWLATISVRAMVLFELLACGRRQVPFGYSRYEPFETFIGYLTPLEVKRLARCLHEVQLSDLQLRIEHRTSFEIKQADATEHLSLPDEVPSVYAHDFTRAVRAAAAQGMGLICNTD
jgi:hypothetical protein